LGPKEGGDGEGATTSGVMENNNRGPGASPVLGNVDGERVVEKLKGYFSLGKRLQILEKRARGEGIDRVHYHFDCSL
jgi:hypothetical protein